MNINKSLVSLDDFNFKKKIGQNGTISTYLAVLSIDSTQCVAKVFNDKEHEIEPKFKQYIQMVQNVIHPGIISIIGYCSSSQNEFKQNIIITKYANFSSLQNVFLKRSQGENISWFDPVRQFIIIYGVAQTMKYMHSLHIIHQRLTPSNILIDENIEPRISDFSLSQIYPKFDYSKQNLIDKKIFYYIDPYTLNHNDEITEKSDIYSFAIITLQILLGNIHIYENEEDLEKLIDEIKNGLMPMISTNFNKELRELLISCVNKDPSMRPSFSQICETLDSVIDSMPEINNQILQEYKQKIQMNSIHDDMSPEIEDMKNVADQGDTNMMYLYAMKRLEGINCHQDLSEATRYLIMAKNNGNIDADTQLSLLLDNPSIMINSLSN